MTSTPPTGDATPPGEERVFGVKVGNLTLTGPAATAILVVVLVAVAALIVWSRPSIGMWLSGAIWVGFIVFWSVTARAGAPTKTAESKESRSLHQNLMNVSLLLLFVPIPGLRWPWLPASPLRVPAGLAVEVAATLLHIWARRHLGRNWSSEVGIKTDHRLVRSGPYRFVRHPIYTAILGLAAGTAIVSGQLHSLLGFVTMTIAYWRKSRLEEDRLRETFGAEFDEYKKMSWALIPGVL